jgi:hypothetical protein
MSIKIKQSFDFKFDRARIFEDLSLYGLLFSNLFSIVVALWQSWNLQEIMWVYWGQSIFIGVINFIRMIRLESFSTKNLKINNQPVPETRAAKIKVALFFLCHYGFFHFVYFFFLWEALPLSALNSNALVFLLLCGFGFLGAHGYSYRYNFNRDFKSSKPNLGTLMFYPYMRIIPMHLTIIIGSSLNGNGPLVLFMIIKTFADLGMHAVEHQIFQKRDISK